MFAKLKYFVTLALGRLKNRQHIDFLSGMYDIFTEENTPVKHIAAFLPPLKELIENEELADRMVRKSSLTVYIREGDQKRLKLYKGMRAHVEAGLLHFQKDKRDAAMCLDIPFKHFKKVLSSSQLVRYTPIYGLLRQLQMHPKEMELLDLNGWAAELEASNERVHELSMKRIAEKAARPKLSMKELRSKSNALYDRILNQLEAAAIVEGEEKYSMLFRRMNLHIKRYKSILERGKGSGKGSKK
jgi:hypothetical protein